MSLAKSLNVRILATIDRRADLLACLSLVVLTLIAEWTLITGGTSVGKDSITQFYPWYSFLGESLRSGNIPGWNPYQFSGAPFAADPLSGWAYLPAMVLFTLLSVPLAAKSYMVFHLMLAGLGTYALARALRMNVAGAAVAALAYEYTGYLFTRNICCFAYPGVSAWLPFAILGAEMAIRSERWLARALWWGLSGLAVSQILAAWLGQGAYYALLALGAYVFYRTVLSPPGNIRGLWRRIPAVFLHGGAVLLFGFALAAAGVLPRLEYHELSNLADGYSGVSGATFQYGGWTFDNWKKLLVPSLIYAGVVPVALALSAPLVARGRHAAPFFIALTLGSLVLAGQQITLLHAVLYRVLPEFDWIHPHGPERIKVILYLGIAMLAGATVSSLRERGRSALALLPVATALFVVLLVPAPPLDETPKTLAESLKVFDRPLLESLGVGIPRNSLIALLLACVYLLIYTLLSSGRRTAAALLALVVFFDLFSAGKSTLAERSDRGGGQRLANMDLAEYLRPTGAAEFLQSRAEDGQFRYVGYGPRDQGGSWDYHYNRWFFDPNTTALLASNQGMTLGIQSIQGYNPVRPTRYDDYIEALNGNPQNYHDTDLLPDGLDSPLLDLLGVRYLVVPASVGERGHIKDLKKDHPTVYSGERVDVLENPDAFPRAWLVHSARQAEPKEALKLLKSEDVDPRKTALLEKKAPPLDEPDDASADRAEVESYEPDRIEVKTSSDAAGMLMLGEVDYPDWRAYVDGEPAEIYKADQLLRAVPVPEGDHTVELRYESPSLRWGIIISLVAAAALVALAVAGSLRWRRERVSRGRS